MPSLQMNLKLSELKQIYKTAKLYPQIDMSIEQEYKRFTNWIYQNAIKDYWTCDDPIYYTLAYASIVKEEYAKIKEAQKDQGGYQEARRYRDKLPQEWQYGYSNQLLEMPILDEVCGGEGILHD